MKSNKKKILLITLSIISVCIVCGFVFVFQKIQKTVNVSKIYNGIKVNNIDIGGKTKDEAVKLLNNKYSDKIKNTTLSLKYNDKNWAIKPDELGIKYDIQQKVDQAYGIARNGGLIKRYQEIMDLKNKNKNLPLEKTVDESSINKRLNEIAKDLNTQPKNADISVKFQKYSKLNIIPEKNGIEMDTAKTLQAIKDDIIKDKGDTVEIAANVLKPEYDAAALKQCTYLLSKFSTNLSSSTENRKHNILLAASTFCGKIIYPGQVFSFNQSTGERTKAKGYLDAPVIKTDNSLEDDTAGGVCQTSTTLYNAVLLSGLDVKSRSHHSFPSSYVSPGFDATVSYPEPDLKFINNTKYPVYIVSYPSSNTITIEIHGRKPDDNISYKLLNDIYERIPAPEPDVKVDTDKKYADKVAYSDEKYVKVKSREGMKVKTYRITLKDGKEMKRELLVNDYYKPVKGLIYTGSLDRAVIYIPQVQ